MGLRSIDGSMLSTKFAHQTSNSCFVQAASMEASSFWPKRSTRTGPLTSARTETHSEPAPAQAPAPAAAPAPTTTPRTEVPRAAAQGTTQRSAWRSKAMFVWLEASWSSTGGGCGSTSNEDATEAAAYGGSGGEGAGSPKAPRSSSVLRLSAKLVSSSLGGC